jgi:hypothetical protein
VGLVLSVSSGVLGKPANVQLVGQPVAPALAPTTTSLRANLTVDQIADFQQVYAWTYVVAGLFSLVVFVCASQPHDIVKSVALTTLGFIATIVGGLGSTIPHSLTAAVQQGVRTVIAIVPRTNVLF